MVYIKEDNYPYLSKYLEASNQKYEVLEILYFEIASKRFRDTYISELENRRLTSIIVYVKLQVLNGALKG